MNSRNSILEKIKLNKPPSTELPIINIEATTIYKHLIAQFVEMLIGIGATVKMIKDVADLHQDMIREAESGKLVVNVIPCIPDFNNCTQDSSVEELAKVDMAYIEGGVAVAENGAIWLNEVQIVNRLLPVVCQQLVLLVHEKCIVSNMHQAYQSIHSSETGYGVFIAGPSKTADIEQSLVIGAHGARSLLVYILG